jgi:predicted PilT family ATPase
MCSVGGETKEAVEAAQMEIFLALQQNVQQSASAVISIANTINILVPDDKVGLIIGKGGMTIKDIQTRTR